MFRFDHDNSDTALPIALQVRASPHPVIGQGRPDLDAATQADEGLFILKNDRLFPTKGRLLVKNREFFSMNGRICSTKGWITLQKWQLSSTSRQSDDHRKQLI